MFYVAVWPNENITWAVKAIPSVKKAIYINVVCITSHPLHIN